MLTLLVNFVNKKKIIQRTLLFGLVWLIVTGSLHTIATIVETRSLETLASQEAELTLNLTLYNTHESMTTYEENERELYITKHLRDMTLEEKVSQMFIWPAQGTDMSKEFGTFLKTMKPGGLMYMQPNVSSQLATFSQDIQTYSSPLPYFISIDQEGGPVRRIPGDTNPGPYAMRNESTERICNHYARTSELLTRNGVNLNFGVMGDIAWKDSSFIAHRSFGSTAPEVAKKSSSAVRCTKKTLSTIKHFPGHGRTSTDSHKVTPTIKVSRATWLKTDALPFKDAIAEGVDFVMMGHLLYTEFDKTVSSLSKVHVKNLRELGFEGIVITDDMRMLDTAGYNPYESLKQAFLAGNDMILYASTPPAGPEKLRAFVISQVRNGSIPEEKIDESVRRILAAKYKIVRQLHA